MSFCCQSIKIFWNGTGGVEFLPLPCPQIPSILLQLRTCWQHLLHKAGAHRNELMLIQSVCNSFARLWWNDFELAWHPTIADRLVCVKITFNWIFDIIIEQSPFSPHTHKHFTGCGLMMKRWLKVGGDGGGGEVAKKGTMINLDIAKEESLALS